MADLAAPPSPSPFGNPLPHCRYHYSASAPTSPARAAAIYAGLHDWDPEKPPACPMPVVVEPSSDFGFCFYEVAWPMPPLATADELFEEGMIRPLIPPPSPSAKKGITASSRGERGSGGDRGEGRSSKSNVAIVKDAMRDRGRSAVSSTGEASSRGWRASRSLSPLRGGRGGVGEEDDVFPKLPSCSSAMLKSSGGGSKKWTLKNLFLFRSASEGRGSRDPLRRYTLLPSSPPFNRAINDRGGAANPLSASAHEIYYSAHRAASEELRRRTPLAYERHSLFGCLRFNPALHSIKRGFFHSRK